MSGMTLALLAGLFAVPALLLWLGHRLRDRMPGARGVFWGALLGHTLGMLVTLGALHYPPVPWGGTAGRELAVHAAMLAGAAAGGAGGWMLGRRSGEGRRP